MRATLGPEATLYVDVNGAVPGEEADAYVALISDAGIVALEDPWNLKPQPSLARRQARSAVPILADFNLDGVSSAHSFLLAGAGGLSVKPARFGAARCLDMAEAAREQGAMVVPGLFGESAASAIHLLSLTERLGEELEALPAEATFHLSFREHYLRATPSLRDGRMTRPAGSLATLVDRERLAALGGRHRRTISMGSI